jgi:DNA-binding transcriptional MocR family regulator
VQRRPGGERTPPPYRKVAGFLRAAIDAGDLTPGQLLPPEAALADGYEVSVDVVRKALGVLRGEGLIVTRQGKGSFVRDVPDAVVVGVAPGARISGRMPSEPERREMGIAEGIPVIVVEAAGQIEVFPADRVVLETVAGGVSA